jgi:asparagine synthase (glutamine-hydrolysing)
MCGLGGIIAAPGHAARAEQAEEFCRILAHRGPDDYGFLALRDGGGGGGEVRVSRRADEAAPESSLYLIHRRLSILDLSEAGWQPMSSHDGRYWLVFNGEIYNFIELRSELSALGHRFHSSSDTEVLLAAWQEWGDDAFPRFVGMFAMAIYDTRARRVVLARDFFGIKPLHYCAWSGGLAFASELQPLLTLPGVDRSVDPAALYFYLRHGVTDHEDVTLFSAIRQLPAAHLCEIDLDNPSQPRFKRYWSIPTDRQADLSFEEAATRLRELFIESVAMHLRSDVPIGAALSGGVDSAAIVTAMRRIGGESLDIRTFSYIADDPVLNEKKWIDIAAAASGARQHHIHVTRDELIADVPRLMRAHDQPVASSSIYAQFRVFERAKQEGVTVMLDGQGADELLAGYRAFLGARLSSMIKGGEVMRAYRFVNAGAALPGVSRGFMLKLAANHLLPDALQSGARAIAGKDLMPSWLSAKWFREHGVEAVAPPRGHGRKALRAALSDAVGTVLTGLLRYEDRNSMHFSIESRVPFLTPQIAEFIFSLPESYIVSDSGETKSVFRAAMRGIVPDAILDRRDKIGFATPEAQWLREANGSLSGVLARGADIAPLDANALAREVEQVRAGARPFHNGIWRSINLITWAETHGVLFR